MTKIFLNFTFARKLLSVLIVILALGCEPTHEVRTGPVLFDTLTSAPTYCKAQVAPEHARLLEQFVVETYNESMKNTPGFKPALVKDGSLPSLSFSDPLKPRFYYAKNRVLFHATLCYRPQSTDDLLRCNNTSLLSTVSSQAASSQAQSAYSKFYEDQGVLKNFFFEKSRNWGKEFVGLPLRPEKLFGKNGEAISTDLHVSLAKIYSSNKNHPISLESKALKDRFSKALSDRFDKLQALLPEGIKLDQIICE